MFRGPPVIGGSCLELMVVSTDQRYLTRAEAAEFLCNRGFKIAPSTLAKRAVIGGGPPFRSWGRKPLYDPASLLEWAQARCTGPRRSTSEILAAGRSGAAGPAPKAANQDAE
jgi:hypothetical protein